MSKENAAGAAPQENKMGVLPVGRLLAGMAVPMMISMLVQALYNIVDSVFVSRLSENAFNAVGLAFPLQSLMIAVGAGTAVGINALLSRSLGQKEQDKVDRTAMNGLLLAVMALGFLGCYIHFFKAYAWGEAFLLSGCVGVALIIAMVVSSLVGTIIPMLFHKIHIDPAVASGPLITTINDLVAVVVYYGLAMIVLIDIFHLG